MRRAPLGLLALCLLAGSGCRQNMHNQNKVEPYEASAFFEDGQGSRQLPDGVVSRNAYGDKIAPYTGLVVVPAPADQGPPAMSVELLRRGQERYNVYCAPCHDRAGTGRGMIVRRGYKQPPSFHEERLRNSPADHFLTTITEGFGVMPSYREEIPTLSDRWAVVAYIRALQYSQNARLADLPADLSPDLRRSLDEDLQTSPGSPSGGQGVTRPDTAQEQDRRPQDSEQP